MESICSHGGAHATDVWILEKRIRIVNEVSRREWLRRKGDRICGCDPCNQHCRHDFARAVGSASVGEESMSYTESGVKMIAEIKKILMVSAVRRGECWYSENGDGVTSHVAFGRVDVLPGGADDVLYTIDIAPIDRDINAHSVGSVLIVTEIDDAERGAFGGGDDDIMLDKIDAAAGTAAARIVDIMYREHAAAAGEAA